MGELLSYEHHKPTQVKDYARKVDEFIKKAGLCADSYNVHILPALDDAVENVMKIVGATPAGIAAQTFQGEQDTGSTNVKCSPTIIPPTFPFRDRADDEACGLEPYVEQDHTKAIAAIDNEAVRNQCEKVARIFVTLPSKYHSKIRTHKALESARRVELLMREAEASEALDELRLNIIASTSVNHAIARAKGQQQKQQLRSRKKEEQGRIKQARDDYTRIRNSMLALGMDKDDEKYRKLNDADVAPFAVTHYEKRKGDSRKTASWLWNNSGYLETLPEGEMKKYVLESEVFLKKHSVF